MNLSLRLSLVSLILVALSFSSLALPVERAGHFVSAALSYFSLSLAREIVGEWTFLTNLREVNTQNASLTAQVINLRGELSRLDTLERENDLLRKQLGLGVVPQAKLVLAQVVGFSPESGDTFLVIDKGTDDGLAKDDLAVLGNYLVGRVEEVEVGRSRVMLLSSPRFSVAVLDQNSPNRAQGVVQGSFGMKLRMEKILPEEQIAVGDLIISSGLDGKIPRGLIVGEVVAVTSPKGGILKEAELKLLFDPRKLEEVFVIKQ